MDKLSNRIDDIVSAIDEARNLVAGIGMMAADIADRRKMNALATAADVIETSLGTSSERLQTIQGEVQDSETACRPANGVTPRFALAYGTYRAEVDAYNAGNGGDETCNQVEQRFLDAVINPARVSTNAEAAILLRHVITSDSIGDTFDEALVEAAIAFLEGRAA